MAMIACHLCGTQADWAVFPDPQHSDPPFAIAYLCEGCREALRAFLFGRLRLAPERFAGISIASLTSDAESLFSADPSTSAFQPADAVSEAERLLGGG